jgi:hypothetical protein
VPSIRFRLDDPSIDALTARVRLEYGDNARILSASEVRIGGVGGFFARRFVDVEVELPQANAGPTLPAGGTVSPAANAAASPAANAPANAPPGAVGLEALLDAADLAERGAEAPPPAPSVPAVSTQTDDFERLMVELRSYAEVPIALPALVPPAPAMVDEAGGLVLFIGLGDDALVVARSLARTVRRSELRVGGQIIFDDLRRVDDRRSASAARAQGVENDSVALVAWGVGMGISGVAGSMERLRSVIADQIWVVVDASRKPADTAAWVGMLRRALPVQAIAVVHSVETATPDSVHGLGLPVGWSDTVG